MSTSSKVTTVREDHAARKDAEAARVAKIARTAKKELDAASGTLDKSLRSVAPRYFRVGELCEGSLLSVRGFAIMAEYGSREAFEATGLAQPRGLSSYRRSSLIFAACDAVGADVTEAVDTYTMDAREAQAQGVKIEPNIAGFAEYCEAGFSLPTVKSARSGNVSHFMVRAAKLSVGLTLAELIEVADLFAGMVADASMHAAVADAVKSVKVTKLAKVA